MTLSFDWVSIAKARNLGLDDLLALNWEEIEDHKDVSPIDINWRGYADLERQGILKLGALTLDGKLIGYNIFFVNCPLHHKSTLWAISDLVYLDPAHRKGRTGVFLFTEAERKLADFNVKIILYGVKLSIKPGRGSVGALLQKLGYRSFDQSWTKTV